MPKEEKEKKGFGRVLSRVKTVLKREGSSSFSKRQSTAATPSTAPTTTKPATSTAAPATAIKTETKTETEPEPEVPKKRCVIIINQSINEP